MSTKLDTLSIHNKQKLDDKQKIRSLEDQIKRYIETGKVVGKKQKVKVIRTKRDKT